MMKNLINKIAFKMGLVLLMSSMLKASAANENIVTLPKVYVISIGLVTLFVLLVLIYSFLRQRKILKDKNELIMEHEDKIKFLRQINAENEYKQTQKEHANEKIILEFKHTIATLEEKINDGTKNQVVAKLEACKNKREQQLKRINLG
jgi:biopolymer transport protein ExbB/TolQ